MRYQHQARKRQQKDIAVQRIATLERLAEAKAQDGDLALAQRYIEHARRISTRLVVPLPSSVKRRTCRHCGHYLHPGVSSRTRISRGRIILYCTQCHEYSRYPLHHKQKQGLATSQTQSA